MATLSLTYNERNVLAQRTIEFIMSLGVFVKVENDTAAKRRTLKAISDVKAGKDVTTCASFEDYLKAVAQGDEYLHGDFVGARECHIQPDWLLIYSKEDENTVKILTLIRTGTHSDLFG